MLKKILLDTNIVIHREIMNPTTNPNIWLLFHWIEKCWYEKCIHPITITEIEWYNKKDIVAQMRNKIKNYSVLKTLSEDNEDFQKIRKLDVTLNDKNDTDILREVYNSRVDYLITEDKKIQFKAKTLWIDYKVYWIDSFLDKLISENPEFNDYKVLSVKKVYIWNLNIKDSFFNSLRDDYPRFNEWFNRKSEETAYVCFWKDKEIQWFLYLKLENENENYSDITPSFDRKKRLKIWTFKVSHPWYKLWERFLKIVFDNAIINWVDEIYLTIHNNWEEKQRLISLVSDWGFLKRGNKLDEDVYVRDFSKKVNCENPLQTYPYMKKTSSVFICPIWPEYHTELFPDSILSTESSHRFIESQPHRNSIRKIFISRSIYRWLLPWDIILFYRTWWYYLSVITTIGVVENVIDWISSLEDFINFSRKRSLFNDNELKEIWNRNLNIHPFIVQFSHVISLEKKLNLKKLIELWIISDIWKVPRWFTKITKEQFDLFINESNVDESYFID